MNADKNMDVDPIQGMGRLNRGDVDERVAAFNIGKVDAVVLAERGGTGNSIPISAGADKGCQVHEAEDEMTIPHVAVLSSAKAKSMFISLHEAHPPSAQETSTASEIVSAQTAAFNAGEIDTMIVSRGSADGINGVAMSTRIERMRAKITEETFDSDDNPQP